MYSDAKCRASVTGNQEDLKMTNDNEAPAKAPGTWLKTSGTGFWTTRAGEVKITALHLTDREILPGEGRPAQSFLVFFDTGTWNTEESGLIYTDPLFLEELKVMLSEFGVHADSMDYSEQGAQSDDIVDFDVGADFIESWKKSFGDVTDVSLADNNFPRPPEKTASVHSP